MENTIRLMQEFELRNNISISVILQGDNSWSVQELWSEVLLKSCGTISELNLFLKSANLKRDKNGLVYNPIEILKNEKNG